jgi:hypothetical protein
MAAFFSITLAISIVGLVLLLVLKRYEMTTGRVVMGGLRPWVGSFFHHALHFVERGMPALMRSLMGKMLGATRTQARRGFARAILLFEYNLERVLHVVRQKSQARPREGVASEFLQEVAAHKQKLLRRTPKNRVIFED